MYFKRIIYEMIVDLIMRNFVINKIILKTVISFHFRVIIALFNYYYYYHFAYDRYLQILLIIKEILLKYKNIYKYC